MIKISGKEIIKKTYTPVAALAPHGSLKFLALMTKIGKPACDSGEGDFGHLRIGAALASAIQIRF